MAQDFANIEISTTPVRNSIYMLQGSGGNIGVLVGDDGALIVDDQYGPLTDKITAAIAELTDLPVEYVINTHFHYDHSDGNENFGRAGAVIVAHDRSRDRMQIVQIVGAGNRVQEPYDEVGLPKLTFLDALRLYYNGNAIDVFYSGDGHTDGDAQVYFRTANVIHTGDQFVRYGLPFIDRPNGGTMEGMIDSLWQIAGMIDDETIIIPGHGQLADRNDLLEFRDMLVTIRGRITTGIADGQSVAQVISSNPARGYADNSESTASWIRDAYGEYSP